AKKYFERTEYILRVEERVVKLVELSKRPMIVGNKCFFGRTDLATLGDEEGAVNFVGATKHPIWYWRQDLHDGGRHSER
ncbi:hypothetical protein L195_g043886, partial [Trifolium pratense]